jgi:DNA-binding protein H-NS
MNAIKKLSGKELEKLINQAASELESRKRIESLNKDIQKVVAKHKVTKAELSTLIDTLKGNYKSTKSKTRAVTKVSPKFRNPAGAETWSGRGRTPKWVAHICSSAGMSVEEFKLSSQYLI